MQNGPVSREPIILWMGRHHREFPVTETRHRQFLSVSKMRSGRVFWHDAGSNVGGTTKVVYQPLVPLVDERLFVWPRICGASPPDPLSAAAAERGNPVGAWS